MCNSNLNWSYISSYSAFPNQLSLGRSANLNHFVSTAKSTGTGAIPRSINIMTLLYISPLTPGWSETVTWRCIRVLPTVPWLEPMTLWARVLTTINELLFVFCYTLSRIAWILMKIERSQDKRNFKSCTKNMQFIRTLFKKWRKQMTKIKNIWMVTITMTTNIIFKSVRWNAESYCHFHFPARRKSTIDENQTF